MIGSRGSGGVGGFSGTATIRKHGTDKVVVSYIDQSMELNTETVGAQIVIPVPQIIYIEGAGRNESLSLEGDFTNIRSEYYPRGETVYAYGDIIATPS